MFLIFRKAIYLFLSTVVFLFAILLTQGIKSDSMLFQTLFLIMAAVLQTLTVVAFEWLDYRYLKGI